MEESESLSLRHFRIVRHRIGDPPKLERLPYVINNPLAYIDPSGLDGEGPGDGGGLPNGPPTTPPGGIAGPYPLIYQRPLVFIPNTAMSATTLQQDPSPAGVPVGIAARAIQRDGGLRRPW